MASPCPPACPRRWLLLQAVLGAATLGGCGDAEVPARTAPAEIGAPMAPAPAPAEPGAHAPTGGTGATDFVGASFSDEAVERGLAYHNHSGQPEKRTVLEANGAGVALLDLLTDGDLDVVFAQGLDSLAALVAGPGADLHAFENGGDGRFQATPGPGLAGWWTGLATGDVDGDGRTDLVAGGFGDLALLRQNAQGVLVPDRTAGFEVLFADEGRRLVPGAERPPGSAAPLWTTSLALFDVDRDGALDLYVGHYLDLDPIDPPLFQLGADTLAVPCRWKGHAVFCGPRGMTPQADSLLRGSGRGRFVDVSAAWLTGGRPAFTLGVAPFDADFDGDTDIYIANDSAPNQLFINELRAGGGALVDRALGAGVAVSPDGLAEAGMGIAVGDVNRDGLFDLAVTNFSDEPTHLYFGAKLGFTCETYRLGLGHATRRMLSWGAHLTDFDGDGWLELFTANGHVYPQADEPGTGTTYGQPDALFRLGPGKLARVAAASPASILASAAGTRGTAVGDVDGDGAPDLVLARIDAPAGLGLNRLGANHHRLIVRCRGPEAGDEQTGSLRTPPDGKGTRVILIPAFPSGTPSLEEFALLAEVQTARGFQSASSDELHFGLGTIERYREITVLWPSGRTDRFPAGRADRRLTIQEGRGIVATEELR